MAETNQLASALRRIEKLEAEKRESSLRAEIAAMQKKMELAEVKSDGDKHRS